MKKINFRTICLLALIFAMPGCGSVDWFPQYVRAPTTPDPFSFTSQIGVATSKPITSNSITVSGLAEATTASPISIAGAAGSTYTVTGADGTVTVGPTTVKNGDKVTVKHTSSGALGTTTVSTLTIGNFLATFTSVTQTVQTPFFTLVTPQRFVGFSESFALITSTLGSHTISITGVNSEFAVSDANNILTVPFTALQQVVPLNGQHILLKIPVSVVDATTTLTIDSTKFQIDNNTLVVTSTPK